MNKVIALFLVLLANPAWCGNSARPRMDLRCDASGAGPVLDCVFQLSTDKRPLSGARIRVGAHMPSMPMAHRVSPALASGGTAPGEYRVRLELEMPGVWALEFDLTSPRRDRLVRRVRVLPCAQASCPAQVLR
ncbi:MAG: hypothetical protein FJY36_04270 [Betaproteobacteria bacterium]|nr:hypothetical protein [Betaproteobacteria bacterium]